MIQKTEKIPEMFNIQNSGGFDMQYHNADIPTSVTLHFTLSESTKTFLIHGDFMLVMSIPPSGFLVKYKHASCKLTARRRKS